MGSKKRRSKRALPQTIRSHKLRTKRRSPAEKTKFFGILKRKKQQKDVKDVSREPIKGWRLWLFRIIAITVIPALLFLLLELALRVAGYGFPASMIVKCKVNDKEAYCDNIKFSWRFFPPAIARNAEPFVFPADKSDNTYRIFVMGASAAAGIPDGAFSFGRILQVMLRQRYPHVNFEVITAAMPAINSHAVLEIAKDCIRHKPDLFIVYLGNNEVVGPYGAGTVFAPLSSNLSFIRLQIAFKSTKVGQLLTNLLELAGTGETPEVWGGLEMFLDKQVRADDPRMEIVYSHFQENLQDIRNLASKNGTKIIFSTVSSNLKDSPPFSSLHRGNLTDVEKKSWNEIYQRGIASETDGDYEEAVEYYLEASKIDNSFADLQFRLGRCYELLGLFDEARAGYIRARELDTLRFRADTRINEIIWEVAGGKTADGVYLVDAVKVFEQNSPHETPGQDLFYEHVHMNFGGGYLLAETFFKQVEEILPERIISETADERPFPTQDECARYLAYTDWDRHRIADKVLNEFIKQSPFTNQLYHSEQVRNLEQELKVLKAALSSEVIDKVDTQYQWAIQQASSDTWLYWKYSLFLEGLKRYEAATKHYLFVLRYVPHHYEAYAKLGFLFGAQGNLDAAVEYNLKAIRLYSSFSEAYFNLGLAYHLQGKYEKAAESYSQSIRFTPNQSQSYNNLALVLYELDKVTESLETYRQGLTFMPDNLNLHYNLGIMLKAQGQREEAIKELRAALKIDPNSAKVHKALNPLLKNSAE